MRRFLLIFSLFTFLAANGSAQKVLDGTFKLDRELYFGPRALNFRHFGWEHLECERKFKDSSYKQLKPHIPLYQGSYLYTEPEFTKVMVMRLVMKKDNPHLSDDFPEVDYRMLPVDRSYVYYPAGDSNLVNFDKEKIISKHSVEYYPFRITRDLAGVNVKAIRAMPGEHSRKKQHLHNLSGLLDRYLETGVYTMDSSGVIHVNKDFDPPEFQIVSLQKALINGMMDGTVTFYQDVDISKPMSRNEGKRLVEHYEDSIEGFRIMEDYYINPLNGELTSRIQRLAFVGEDTAFGKEICWMTYPEACYALTTTYTKLNHQYYCNAEVLDDHLFNGLIENDHYIPEDAYKYWSDIDYSVKLLPLVALDMHMESGKTGFTQKGIKKFEIKIRKGLPKGRMTQYYDNGTPSFTGTMKNGQLNGTFHFNFPDGKPKALRHYENGSPEGSQFNYHANGVLNASYSIEKGFITRLRRQYPDASLLEEGSFSLGLLSGTWIYHIKCDTITFNNLRKCHYDFNEEAMKYNTDGFSFKVSYSYESKPDCPIVFDLFPLNNVCLKSEYVE